jgi:hypothetical protein
VAIVAILLLVALGLVVLLLRLGVQTLRSAEWPRTRWARLLVGWGSVVVAAWIVVMVVAIAGPA